MRNNLKVYEVKFNSYGTIHVVASNYSEAAETYEKWVKQEFPEATEWTTRSITELPSSKPTLVAI